MLLITRDEVIDKLDRMIAAPITRTIRGLETEVVLTPDDGMPTMCAVNPDHVGLVHKQRVGKMICTLPLELWDDIRTALLTACGFPEENQPPE